jgi:membrane-associated phospholipid phosphatase
MLTLRSGRAAADPGPRVPAGERVQTALIGATIALLGFVAVFGAVKANRSQRIDVAITLRMQARRYAALRRVMEAFSWPGFPPQSRIIPPTIIVLLLALNLRVEAFFQLLAWGTAGISEAIKRSIRRPRPLPEQVRVVIAPLGGSSFPSGHVLTYVGTYGFLAVLVESLVRDPLLRRAGVGGLLVLLAGVGPSRIYQGHHWPTDVAASYLLGTSYVIVLTAAYRRVRGS